MLLFLSLMLITSIVAILGNSIVYPSNAQNTIEINKISIEDLLLLTKGTLAPFWHAIDIVKTEGYSLEHFTESGMDSKENPTRIYAILEK